MRKRIHDLAEKGRITDGPFASFYGDRFGAFMLLFRPTGGLLKIIASAGDVADKDFPKGTRWDHVSVSLENRTPTWEEIAWIKSLFFDEEECAIEYHPPKSKYVNVTATTLHIWRPLDVVIPMPPMECV